MLPTDCINPTFAACTNGLCVHKAVFPATGLEIGGVIILPLLLGFANNGGIGGGGLIIPVCIFMFGFNTIQAIAISNSTIFVGAALYFFSFSKHSASRTSTWLGTSSSGANFLNHLCSKS